MHPYPSVAPTMCTSYPATSEALLQDAWFSSLPLPMQQGLLSLAAIKPVRAGRRIFSRGDPSTGVYALLEGSILVSGDAEPGESNALIRLGPPMWFGEIGLFDGASRTHHVDTAQDCTLLWLPMGPLRQFLDANPVYWKHVALLLTQKLRFASLALDELAKTPPQTRVARRLVWMSVGLNPQTARDTIDIRQDQLAEMMGMSRTSVNAMLREMQRDGLVQLTYGRIRLLDADRLKRVARYEHWQPDTPRAALNL